MTWQRTILVIALVAIAAAIAIFAPDANPEIVAAIVGTVSFAGGLVAKTPGKRETTNLIAGFGLGLGLMLAGCAATSTAIDADRVTTRGSNASSTYMDNEGNQSAAYHDIAPTTFKQDGAGTWGTTPGQGGIVTFNPETNQLYVWSPKDGRIDRIVFPDGTKIEGFEFNMSPVVTAYTPQVVERLAQLSTMNKQEAEALVEQWKQAGGMWETLADVASEVILPTLRIE